eukprot:3345034-Lingulodinium_polyedra.AAC.1
MPATAPWSTSGRQNGIQARRPLPGTETVHPEGACVCARAGAGPARPPRWRRAAHAAAAAARPPRG